MVVTISYQQYALVSIPGEGPVPSPVGGSEDPRDWSTQREEILARVAALLDRQIEPPSGEPEQYINLALSF